jgi:CO/xanthine dehydrogenase Mo-binding subunit
MAQHAGEATDAPVSNGLGRSVQRIEDDALLRGRGRFVDDVALPGMLHAAFLRSPYAHGRLNRIDVTEAQVLPGVHRVFTYADLRAVLTSDRIPLAMPAGAIRFDVDPFVLARDEVCHVGEPVALVIADSRHIAEDALGLIAVDIEPLPAIVDPRGGLAEGAPTARTISLPARPCNMAISGAPSRMRRMSLRRNSISTRAAVIPSRRAASSPASTLPSGCSPSGTARRCRTRPNACWCVRSGLASIRYA